MHDLMTGVVRYANGGKYPECSIIQYLNAIQIRTQFSPLFIVPVNLNFQVQ